MRAFTLILICQLIGELIVNALGLPIPGPVVGMALLFVGLRLRGETPADFASGADTLLRNLSLLFVPAGVGVMALGAVIGQAATPIATVILVSTLLGIAAAALTMRALTRGARKQGGE
jgi:putative effector of murein hydrolase LrgA (UPF0299 family)